MKGEYSQEREFMKMKHVVSVLAVSSAIAQPVLTEAGKEMHPPLEAGELPHVPEIDSPQAGLLEINLSTAEGTGGPKLYLSDMATASDSVTAIIG